MRVSFSTLVLLKYEVGDVEASKALRRSKDLLMPAHEVNMTVGCFYSRGKFNSHCILRNEAKSHQVTE